MNDISEKQFWNGISIFLRNYHAVNRKIFACVISEVQHINKGIAELTKLEATKLKAKDFSTDIACSSCDESELQANLANSDKNTAGFEGFLLHFKYLTKKLPKDIEAIGIIDFSNTRYTCKFLCQNFDDFCIQYSAQNIEIEILTQHLNIETSMRWAEYVLKPKLLKWCCSSSTNADSAKIQVSSLQLIDLEAYNCLYKELKHKFAEQTLKYWHDAKESTDPLKFIYEDLAIAAYLITLWRNANYGHIAPTAFADLGCGNGLLVYILCEMGFKGYGYDIRARKLWSHYPKSASMQLIEQAIVPNDFKVPAEVDWLIGNHSDELSPWLPVLAANASFTMRYFLLPCCAYELSGAKFQRRDTKTSAYQDFYIYAENLSKHCGYKTLQDRLKIPSTKRLALLGIERTHAQNEYESRKRKIQQLIAEEMSKHPSTIGNEIDIKLREKCELVRNCTQIDRNILAKLVEHIFKLLLANDINEQNDNKQLKHWRSGGRLSMREIVQKLTSEELKQIKAECGGIKTLLRNHHEIFEFCGGDLVGIRRPQIRVINENKPQTIKKRFCFFKRHHPNGCLLSDAECTFIH